jgi:N-acetylneuraminate synthase
MRKKPFLIGEIGINHNGSLALAKKIISIAKHYGFDSVKFQKRDPDICVPDDQKNKIKETPWGEMTYLEYKKKIEFGLKEYKEIKKFCKKKKIEVFASAWDINSLTFLKKLNFNYNKIPSALLTNFDLIKEVAKERKKTFISTGGADLSLVDKVIKIFKKNSCPYIIMHCVSIYPAADEMLNLNYIKVLQKKYGINNVGYSGHESTVLPSIAAMVLGATAIERHITTDRTLWGTDQASSLSPSGMNSLISSGERLYTILGKSEITKKKYLNLEKQKLKTMIYW